MLTALSVLNAQEFKPYGAAPTLRVQSNLVLINTLVTDRHGRVVTGLDASMFRLFEDGKEQVIKHCVSDDAPVSIALVLDVSESMSDKLALMKEAARRFVGAANRTDEYLVVEFSASPEVTQDFTRDTTQLIRSIDLLQAGGSTALFDAVHVAVHEMRQAAYSRKAVLIISDGVDTHSRHTEHETRRLASEVDFPIYAINVWTPVSNGSRYAMRRSDPATLEKIAPQTGGRVFAVRDLKKIPDVTALISEEIRYEYVLSYVPVNRSPGVKYRRVRVAAKSPTGQHLRVSNRAGYDTSALFNDSAGLPANE